MCFLVFAFIHNLSTFSPSEYGILMAVLGLPSNRNTSPQRRPNMKKLPIGVMTVLLTAALAAQAGALPAERTAEIEIPRVGSVTPVIDGIFDPTEGWGEPLIHIDSSNYKDYITEAGVGFSSNDIKAYYRWDETNFYFCCVVEDKDHTNATEPGGNPWCGDSIRFDMKTDVESDDLSDTSKYWFALCNDGNVYFYHEIAESGLEVVGGDAATSGYKVVHDKDAGTTVYEVAVKWSQNLNAESSISSGLEFITAQRILEQSSGMSEPEQAVQLAGYSADNGTIWFVATLADALPEAEETVDAPVEADVVTDAVETTTTAPQTFDTGVIAAAAAIVSAAGFTLGKKRK